MATQVDFDLPTEIGRRKALKALSSLAVEVTLPTGTTAPKREWTIMVYMNGKNNLEPDALNNFRSISAIGSTDKVAIVVELGRPKKNVTNLDGPWSGVYRFFIQKNTEPLPAQALANVEKLGEATDMASAACLSHFVRWAKHDYPAKRYMLVIWNHGQGWRFLRAKDPGVRSRSARGNLKHDEIHFLPASLPYVGGYRAVSSDDDTGNLMYNSEIQAVLESEFSDKKLDILGFDACLMGMIETAYAFSPSVEIMVASQELEPADGWNYEDWLSALIDNPIMSSEKLSEIMVESYGDKYRNRYLTTLSALRLDNFRGSARLVSDFANVLRDAGPAEWALMIAARKKLNSYGDSIIPPLYISVDLISLLVSYQEACKSEKLRSGAGRICEEMKKHIIKNYASSRSSIPYGSNGIAIYFPKNQQAFINDGFHDGYLKSNVFHPVDFVIKETWSNLLYSMLKIK